MFQYRVVHNEIQGNLGLALAHPLYHLLGGLVKAVPVGEVFFRINLISAVAGALAVANLFLLVRIWTGMFFPALIGALSLALSHTHWLHCCIAEVYTLYLAIFLAELVVLLKYCKTGRVGYLYWLGVLNGLSIANHMWGSIPLVCYVVFVIVLLVKKKISGANVGMVFLLWLIGFSAYGWIIIQNMIQSGDVTGTISSALFGNGWQNNVLNTQLTARVVKENIMFIGMNFPTPNVLLGLVGIYVLYRISPERAFSNVVLALLILFLLFAFRYTVPDRYAFFLPFYAMVSIFIGLGSWRLLSGGNALSDKQLSSGERLLSGRGKIMAGLMILFALMVVPVYAALPVAARKMNLSLGTGRQIPYRDEYQWFLQPWKTGYHGPRQFAVEALAVVEENGLIYADGTTVYALLLAQQSENLRPDVTIVSSHGTVNNLDRYGEERIDELFREHKIYVVSPVAGYCPGFLLEKFEFESVGIIWRAKIKDQSEKDENVSG